MPVAEDSIRVHRPDGRSDIVPRGTTVRDLGLEGSGAIAARVNGALVDLTHPILVDAEVEVVTSSDPAALEILRHSTAHATAQAVQELFPGTRIAQGPVIEDGFYYDFDREAPFTPEDLEAIEARVREIIRRDLPVERLDLPREEAIAFFEKEGEPYKVYFAATKGGESVSIYRQGNWTDFCRGPHVPSTGHLAAFKLLSVAGAYWLGDERNKMLQRIYGTAFFSQEELDSHLRLLEEAKRRDHRKLGRELRLFSFHADTPASPFFHPRGATVYNLLIGYVRELYGRYGYSEVITPQLFDASLWKRSGHYDHYRENMYFTAVDEREFALKPMNCPSHCLMFAEGRHSYRELPMRLADFGRLHRYERSGATAGLTRVRTFSQDDAHIFLAPEQIEAEVTSLIQMYLECYALFGMSHVRIFLSTRPEKRAGRDELWEHAETALESALRAHGHPFSINAGDGAFYGPKIDFIVLDALKREHQLGTVQLDYVLPERFDLCYIDAEDREQRPVMVHRAMLGSIERFFGVLIEHCAGAFPFWLAPEQVRVLPITDRVVPYASEVRSTLSAEGLRAEIDARNEKIGAKIREAQIDKTPFMLVVGDREAQTRSVAVRSRRGGDLGPQSLDAFLAMASALNRERRNEP
jgi:threonyl-tRNA synthetase